MIKKEHSALPFSDEIEVFEKNDRKSPPSHGVILFVGSSSFKMWETMENDLAPLPVINRGFGGSTFADLLNFTDRIVIPYRPKIIVVYEGDNDLAGNPSAAETVLDNCRKFVQHVHKKLPDTMIFLLPLKPSPIRLELWPEMAKLNVAIAKFADKTENVGFIDIATPMLRDGAMRKELFIGDKLHMNWKGYAIWTSVIKPVLEKAWLLGA